MSRLIIKPRKSTRYRMAVLGSIFPSLIVLAAFVHGLNDYIKDASDVLGSLAMLLFGVLVWLYFETSRYVVEDGYLSEKKFGLTLWKIDSKRAEISEIEENGFTYWIVSNRETQKRIGKIYCVQFYPADLQRLLEVLFPDAISEP